MNMNTQEETRKDNKKDREEIAGELEYWHIQKSGKSFEKMGVVKSSTYKEIMNIL